MGGLYYARDAWPPLFPVLWFTSQLSTVITHGLTIAIYSTNQLREPSCMGQPIARNSLDILPVFWVLTSFYFHETVNGYQLNNKHNWTNNGLLFNSSNMEKGVGLTAAVWLEEFVVTKCY
jgi:hypothetical protein